MKVTKRIISIMMVLIMLVSVFSVSAEAAKLIFTDNSLGNASLVPTDSKYKKTLSTVYLYGDYDYLYLKGKTSAQDVYLFYEICSDKEGTNVIDADYVSISNGGIKAPRKIKLKGKYKSKTYYMFTYAAKINSDGNVRVSVNSFREFKVKVDREPAFTDNIVALKSTSNTCNGPKISWYKVSGTNKYYIYRKSQDGTKWKKVGTASGSKTSFTDTSLKKKNGNYIYTVKAINKKGKATRYSKSGVWSNFAKAPTMKSITVTYNNAIEIKWNSTSSKAKYTILRKEGDGKWQTLKTNYSGTSYKDTSVKNGKKYTYSIKAVIPSYYGTATSSYYSNSSKAVTYLKSPTLKGVSAVENGIKISWGAVSSAKGYTILRKNSDGSTGWSSVGKVKAGVTSFVDESVNPETSYIYSVRSEASKNKGSYNRTGIEFVSLPSPQDVSYTFDEETNGVKIRWRDVPLADQYKIYTMDENGQWELVKKVKDTSGTYCSATIVPQKYGKLQYTVTALRNGGNETTVGKNVYEMDFYPQIKYISFVSDKKISLSWLDNNSDAYNVYKKEAAQDDSQFVLIGTTADNFFDDADVENDVLYTYQVKAIVDDVEQHVNIASHTVGISTTLTCEPRISTYGETIYLNGATEVFGFNFEKGKWEPVVKRTRTYQAAYLNDGKYRYAFANEANGFKSILENHIVDHEWYDYKPEYTLKLVDEYTLEVKITNPPEDLKEFEVYIGTKEVTIKADGSDSYTCELSYFCNTSTNYADVAIRTKNTNGDVSVVGDNFYYMNTPEISKIKRQSNGSVKLTINQSNYDDIGWDGYYIYRKVYGESKYEQIAVVDSPTTKWYEHETTYTDTTAEKDVKYVYLVKTFKIYNGETYVSYYDKATIK
ncbi:MAG: fibronectin type III domain-containing protein [Acutalibacteraceae bacterium]|nr:fibronectin type III domain-containing protein [Acutalibacteraceae bacterium]